MIRTDLPCPWWCEKPRGHGWDNDDTEELGRFHTVKAGSAVIGGAANGTALTSRRRDVAVIATAMEIVTADDERVVDASTPVLMVMDFDENAEFDAAQARQLAAALLNAADRLDEIRGATS